MSFLSQQAKKEKKQDFFLQVLRGAQKERKGPVPIQRNLPEDPQEKPQKNPPKFDN